MDLLSITNQLQFSTLRIEVTYGNATGSGTGFIYMHQRDNKEVPILITNKHVVKGGTKGRFKFHIVDENTNRTTGETFFLEINDRNKRFEDFWTFHPDADMDLCALPLAPLLKQANDMGKSLFYISLDSNLLPDQTYLETLNVVEDIIMIGYPNGLSDEVNNLPLFRRGITATHVAVDYCGKHEFVVDMACFPGSSGSPIFLFNQGAYSTNTGDSAAPLSHKVGTRLKLLGILYAGPVTNVKGEISLEPIPTTNIPTIQSSIMIHLGYVIKSKEINVLCNEIDSNRAWP